MCLYQENVLELDPDVAKAQQQFDAALAETDTVIMVVLGQDDLLLECGKHLAGDWGPSKRRVIHADHKSQLPQVGANYPQLRDMMKPDTPWAAYFLTQSRQPMGLMSPSAGRPRDLVMFEAKHNFDRAELAE